MGTHHKFQWRFYNCNYIIRQLMIYFFLLWLTWSFHILGVQTAELPELYLFPDFGIGLHSEQVPASKNSIFIAKKQMTNSILLATILKHPSPNHHPQNCRVQVCLQEWLARELPWQQGVSLLTRMASWRSSLTSFNAPMSSQVTSGIVANPSLLAEGWTCLMDSYRDTWKTAHSMTN